LTMPASGGKVRSEFAAGEFSAPAADKKAGELRRRNARKEKAAGFER
jgi:hypothetical protein